MTQSLHSTLANFTYRQTGGVFTQLKKAVSEKKPLIKHSEYILQHYLKTKQFIKLYGKYRESDMAVYKVGAGTSFMMDVVKKCI